MANAKGAGSGRLVISVDLESDLRQQISSDGLGLDAVTDDLLQILARHRLPATWAVADPVHSAATESVLNSNTEHEMGVLGDSSWVGPGSSRSRFARELARRIEGARERGLSVSSLLLRDVLLSDHLDLLVKHRVSIVRQGTGTSGKQTCLASPQPLRFGLWQLPESLRLPRTTRWPFGVGQSVRRVIGRAISSGQTVHLVIDAPRLVDSGNSGLHVLEHVLRYAQQQQQRGNLQIVPLGQLGEGMKPKRRSQSSRSVLRPAA